MDFKGLITDSLPTNSPTGSWRYAKNILVAAGFRSIANEDGFDLSVNHELSFIGIIPTDKKIITFSTNNSVCKIGYILDDVYTEVLSESSLGFNVDYPIEGIWKYNNNGDIIIVFTDFLNEIRILNIDNVPTPFNLKKIALFPDFDSPTSLVQEELENGGNLLSGVYYTTYRYISASGVKTNYAEISQPFSITENKTFELYNDYDGIEAGTSTTKAIRISLIGVDTGFDFIEIAIIKKIGGQFSAESIAILPITGTEVSTTYTGSKLNDLVVDDIIVQSVNYPYCKSLTLINDKLFLGNLKTDDTINLQKYVNNISVTYSTSLTSPVDADTTKLKTYSFDYKSLMPREVYCLYLVCKLKKGGFRAFHIPGRAALAGETAASAFAVAAGLDAGTKVYQIEDTCDMATGRLSYHENQNENYPTGAQDVNGDYEVWDNTGYLSTLQNTPVRHHRMPSINYLKANEYVATASYGITERELITLTLSDVYIPTEIAAMIDYWTLGIAERTVDNSLVLGQDIAIAGGKTAVAPYTDKTRIMSFHTRDNPTASADDVTSFSTTEWSGRCFDLILNKPNVLPHYIAAEYKLQLTTKTSAGAAEVLPLPETGATSIALDYTTKRNLRFTPNKTDTSINATTYSIANSLKAIETFRYIAPNVEDGDIVNINNSESIYFKLSVAAANWAAETLYGTNNDWYAPIISYMRLLSDVYLDYTNQTVLLSNNKIQPNVTTGNFSYGDTFVTDFNTTSKLILRFSNHIYPNVNTHLRALLSSAANMALRHIDSLDDQTKYYPKDSTIEWDMAISAGQKIAYNTDYSSLNNLNSPNIIIHNYKNLTVNNFPFRIASSEKLASESRSIFIGEFLANNYYDLTKDKGEIWKLNKFNNALLINCKNSFFVSNSKDKLATNISEIYVGTGEILDRPPEDVLYSATGYSGCQSQYASFVCKIGLVFVDREQGKIFLFNGGNIKEISNKGNRNYFRDKLNTLLDIDNPFTSIGLTGVFDEKYNRLIIAKKEYRLKSTVVVTGELVIDATVYTTGLIYSYLGKYYIIRAGVGDTLNILNLFVTDGINPTEDGYGELIDIADLTYYDNHSFTLSYSVDFDFWVCYHDYYPSYMFQTRLNSYAINNHITYGKLYKMNSLTTKATYFSATVYESFVDLLFNSSKAKLWQNVSWNTDVINRTNKSTLEDNTITSIFIHTGNQCTKIETIVNSGTLLNRRINSISRNNNRSWVFNKLRDYRISPDTIIIKDNGDIEVNNINNAKSWIKVSDIISEYIVCRLITNNTNQYNIYINDVNASILELNNN